MVRVKVKTVVAQEDSTTEDSTAELYLTATFLTACGPDKVDIFQFFYN